MGLDMYLRGQKYISGYPFASDPGAPDRVKQILALADLTDAANLEATPSITIEFGVAYWRKANQVHSWFVKNVQDGVDNCKPFEVGREGLAELVSECQSAIAAYDAGNKTWASEIMTPASGFFFGSQDVDDYYRSDLQDTVDQLEKAILLPDDIAFIYQSSW